MVYVSCTAAVMLFVAAAAMLVVERGDPDSNIKTFPNALWWAATTVTTVGYGDRYPVTAVERQLTGDRHDVGTNYPISTDWSMESS